MRLNVDDFARYIFLEHPSNVSIDISMADCNVNTSKDIFYFCMDLLLKGIVIMFGKDNKVNVDEISREQFDVVNRRLSLIGIRCTLAAEALEYPLSTIEALSRIRNMYSLPEDLDLKDYAFEISSGNTLYRIKFDLFHNAGNGSFTSQACRV